MPRILIVKTSSMGDVVHNLPLVTDIAANVPGAEIDWAVEDAFADIPRMHAAVQRVIPLAFRRWRRGLHTPRAWREVAAFVRALRAQSYDIVLDTQGLLKSALIARVARGLRAGPGPDAARERLAGLFYARRLPMSWSDNAVVRMRSLGAAAFGYALPPGPPDYGVCARTDTDMAPAGAYAVCLHASSRDTKLWPQASWLALAQGLRARGVTTVWPGGSEAEVARAEAFARALPGAVALPRLPLAPLAAVLAHARVVIGVDTGLVHLAAALRVPTIALFVDSDPAATGVVPAAGGFARNLGGPGHAPRVDEVSVALSEAEATWG